MNDASVNAGTAAPSIDAPLAGVRVLECGDTLAAAYAGRLFTDLGADVIVVEDVGGHPLRSAGPFLDASPGCDRSVGFAYYAAGKRSISLDLDNASNEQRMELVQGADVVIRSTRNGRDWIGDDVLDRARTADPGLVVVDVSTFGRQTPAERHPMSDLIALAAGGLLSLNATAPGDPTSTPLRYRGEVASVHAGCDAVVAVLGALFERRRSGFGQHIDVSAQAAVVTILATAVSTYTYTGVVPVHDGRRGVAPWGFFACRDGDVLLQVTEDSQWQKLVKLFGDPDWGHLEVFATTAQRSDAMDVLDPLVAEAISAFTASEFLAACHAHGVAAAKIHDAADLLCWEQLTERAYFQPIEVADDSRRAEVLVPSPPWRFGGETPARRGPVPRLPRLGGPATARWAPRTPIPPTTVGPGPGPEGPVAAPLAGVRVVDLTWVWAGPYAAMQLAHLGADVVKIESSGRLDVTRVLGPWADGVAGCDRSGYFNQQNQGKQAALLDLMQQAGRDVLWGLISKADIVISNMRPGALDRMGFSYEAMHAVNPGVVAVSMTGFGETGPERDRMAYGSLIDALSGVAAANGAVGGGPTDFPMSLPDPCAGIHTIIATLAALYRAQETGVGTHVELSMLEASVSAFPWPVLHQSVAGKGPPVEGNRDELRAPHDVYRCLGAYEWVAIAVDDDEQFAALARTIGRPELARHRRFSTLAARRLHADELDTEITTWTLGQDAGAAAAGFRAAGVPAERVAHMNDLFSSVPLMRRRYFLEHDHPEVGIRQMAGTAWSSDRSPMSAATAAPCLGQHTRSVLERWLGLDAAAVELLDEAGVLS